MQPSSGGYRFDADDPRAPTEQQWAAMSPSERARVVAMLPAEVPWELSPPEGDDHSLAKMSARQVLDGFFRSIGRKVYVSSELGVFYPNEPRFAPDILAVLDVEPHRRQKWVVAAEGKGLDFVLEVHVAGDASKDFVFNVDRYARLGIREYFILDVPRGSLRGYRLPETERTHGEKYRPIIPQGGRYASDVLGLELRLEGTRVRFYYGMIPIPESAELIAKLDALLGEVMVSKETEIRAFEQELAESKQELADREAQLAAVRAELERLKRERGQ
jgi:hypothetical protein